MGKKIQALLMVLMVGIIFMFSGCASNTGEKGMFSSSKEEPAEIEVQVPKYTNQNFTQAHKDAMPQCAKQLNADWARQGRNMKIVLVEENSFLSNISKNAKKAAVSAAALVTGNLFVGKFGEGYVKGQAQRQKFAESEMRTCIYRRVGKQAKW